MKGNDHIGAEKDKVSIIVPIYNVRAFLEQTLESIRKQTYRNIEVLLIDDGSTDGSGAICDKYHDADDRFFVFHIENGGVSKARNYGLDRVTGDYVMFIDSDDLVNPKYIQLMLHIAKSTDSRIVTCKFLNGEYYTQSAFEEKISTDHPEIVKTILHEYRATSRYAHNGVWAGIYKTSLTKGLRFTSDLYIGEDTLYFYQMFKRAGSLTFINEGLYYYRYRGNSLLHSQFSEKQLTEITSWERAISLFEKMPPSFLNEFYAATGIRCKKILMKAIRAGFDDQFVIGELFRKTGKYGIYVVRSREISVRSKLLYCAFLCAPRLYVKLSLARQKRRGH